MLAGYDGRCMFTMYMSMCNGDEERAIFQWPPSHQKADGQQCTEQCVLLNVGVVREMLLLEPSRVPATQDHLAVGLVWARGLTIGTAHAHMTVYGWFSHCLVC